jgi:G3E family GTPase
MTCKNKSVQAVPTNVITGFLGVGKTTAILHLLRNKPPGQRWAVLVNEFGEIGVDGGLIEGHQNHEEGKEQSKEQGKEQGKEQSVFIREVPGGCMCCAAGLPMQVALNQLLSSASPDRVLIEPTGLGHPKEVLQVLSSGGYRKALSVEKVITLVNAQHLSDHRYTESEIFNQQIEVADIVVGNKSDLYQENDRAALQHYAQDRASAGVDVVFTVNGEMESSLLQGPSRYVDRNVDIAEQSSHAHDHADSMSASTFTLPESGFIKKLNEGDGYYSVGWRFREDMVFTQADLFSFLNGVEADRIKAVMNTENGVIGYNMADGSLTELALFGRGQSCIEIIGESVSEEWETQLLQCLADRE